MKRMFTLMLFLFYSFVVNAAEILAASLRADPQTPFVNQSFDLLLEFAIPLGCEFENVSFTTTPNLDKLLDKGSFELIKEERKRVNNQDAIVYIFRRKARFSEPFSETFQGHLNGMLVERTKGGAFHRWFSTLKQVHLQPFKLEVLPVPSDKKPQSFSGAVGNFTLSGKVSSNRVHPGDIVNLELSLKGDSDLSGISLSFPDAAEGFKVYPAKETGRTRNSITGTQVWIPANTNATTIPPATFSFYNPKSQSYETSSAGPFTLVFVSGDEASTNSDVRVIHTEQEQNRFDTVVPSALRLDTVGKKLHRIENDTQAHFAPSQRAAVLFSIPQGAEVLPLEKASQWLRVDYNGRRGWILE